MNKLIASVTFLVILSFVNLILFSQKISLIGTIQFPDLENIPALCVYYKGNKIEFDSGHFVIREDSNIEKLNILVSENIKPCSEKKLSNGLLFEDIFLTISPKFSNKYYELTRKFNESENKKNWNITETKIDKLNFKVPDNTIVILFDPKYVEKLILEEWQDSKNVIKLPKVVIKTSDKNGLLEASIRALLSSPDLNSVHTKERKRVLDNTYVTISILEDR